MQRLFQSTLLDGQSSDLPFIFDLYRLLNRMQGMSGAWELWKSGTSASLLANCGTWVKLEKGEIKKLYLP